MNVAPAHLSAPLAPVAGANHCTESRPFSRKEVFVRIGGPLISVCRLALILSAGVLLQGCIRGVDVQIRDGQLNLNPHLRADMEPSAGMPDGRYFADGKCDRGSADTECRYVSPVRGNLVNAANPNFIHRLPKSDFLWIAGGNGFPLLSYEFVGEHVSIVDKDDPRTVFFTDLNVGTCHQFPGTDPETRQGVLGNVVIPESITDQYVRQFDVTIRECDAPLVLNGVSETLEEIVTNCSDTSVLGRLAGNLPTRPQNAPFCLVGLGLNTLMGDASFSVTPGAAPGMDINDLWPSLSTSPHKLLPNLKTVPVDGKRTISRPLNLLAPNDRAVDGTLQHLFEFRVRLVDGGGWSETFSPNIFVTRVRVRRGAFVPNGTNYLPIRSLKIGPIGCQLRVPGSDDREFDIPMCQADSADMFRVTPAYLFSAITQGRLLDDDRPVWRVGVDATLVPPNAEDLFLEMDLAVDIPPGSSRSGLLLAEPPARDLGSIPKGQPALVHQGFFVRNSGIATVSIESVEFVNNDAAEFGTPLIYHAVPPAGATTPSTAPTPLAAPIALLAGSAVEVKIQPMFQSAGRKRTQVVVHYRGIRNTPQSISMPVIAEAVSPFVRVMPENVYFNATPTSALLGAAQAQRAVLIENAGSVAYERTGASISGPQASSFRVLSSQLGLTPSDPSQPAAIGPGNAETFRLGFFPQAVGESHAVLTILTSEGQSAVNLIGYCVEHCRQPPALTVEDRPSLPSVTARKPVYPKLSFPSGTFGLDTGRSPGR